LDDAHRTATELKELKEISMLETLPTLNQELVENIKSISREKKAESSNIIPTSDQRDFSPINAPIRSMSRQVDEMNHFVMIIDQHHCWQRRDINWNSLKKN
jgi:hypothetical protein